MDGTTANSFWNTTPSSFCLQSKCSNAEKVVLEPLHLVYLRNWKSFHEKGRGQLCSLWIQICPEEPLSSYGVHKTKIFQVAAKYFSPHFVDFQLAYSWHYRNVKLIPVSYIAVLWKIVVQKRWLFVEKLYQTHLSCASEAHIFWLLRTPKALAWL